jgi:hypothetical protein
VEDKLHKPLFVKQLIKEGYKDKQICMIAQVKQPYVSKIRNGKIHQQTKIDEFEQVIPYEDERSRQEAMQRILELPELYTPGTTEQDLIYMHLLKFLMVEKEDVYNLYFHLSKRQFNRYWVKKDVDITLFDSELIGIDSKVYLDLIIDYFL